MEKSVPGWLFVESNSRVGWNLTLQVSCICKNTRKSEKVLAFLRKLLYTKQVASAKEKMVDWSSG